MPRSSQYLLEGYTYHLTHRCHNRKFLLRFARDRDVYRKWLLKGVRRHGVSVYGFCITSNHVHIIVHVDHVEDVSSLMQLAAGSTAKQYNIRKGHLGSLWEHPYQCTMIQDGRHLFNCLCYVDLNMIRAGVVSHPTEWNWCGYNEIIGKRTRFRILNTDRLLESLGINGLDEFRKNYMEAIKQRLATNQQAREAHWTESLAVGSHKFTEQCRSLYHRRSQFDIYETPDTETNTWTIKEPPAPYGSI